MREIQAVLPAGVVFASGHAVAAGRDVHVSAAGSAVAAAVIHGNVAPLDPTRQGPLNPLAVPAIRIVESGAVVAIQGVAVGQLQVPQQQATAGRPVQLASRPVLAGREALLAELGARLSAGDGSAPCTIALSGLGGAGKTSVAVEYAYRHLAEVGVAWQFPAGNTMVLAAGFAELAAQLGVRGLPPGNTHRTNPQACQIQRAFRGL